MGGKSKRERGRSRKGKRAIDDNKSNLSDNAVILGDEEAGGESSTPVAAKSTTLDVEGGSDEDNRPSKARIFDFRRTSIIVVSLVVIIISVAAGSTRGFAKPPSSFDTATATPPHPTEDGLPHLHKYAYVFVAYDKSGHNVALQLYEQLDKTMEERNKQKNNTDGLKHPSGGHLKEQFIDTRSVFNMETKCTEFNLEAKTVTILESPEFHCNMQKLRSLFMDHKDLNQEKWGVKLIHLVRNPFAMAVANYQDRKSHQTHEEIRFKNPCSSLTKNENLNMTVADLNSPILSENGIMTREDFNEVLARCNAMFQTQPGLETAGYQQHLEQLPPADGLKLAVADGLHGIALMASDLITFRRVHEMVRDEASNPKRKKVRHLDMLTLPLDTVLNYPGDSMMHYMNFIFGTYVSDSSKRKAAAEYERNRIVDDSADAAERGALIGVLKNDPLVGGPLKRVESLLDSVLSEQKSEAEM